MTLRKKLRALIAAPGLTVLPGAYDALSARIIAHEGFEAIMAGGYAASGSLLAQADMGQSNMRDYADHYARICAAVDIPVFCDGDTGFGGTQNVRQMVRAFEAAGAAALFITDQSFPPRCNYLPGKKVVPVVEMIAKIKAALDARRDSELLICARTDVASIEGLDAAIERCQAFMRAGADMAKPQGVHTIGDMARVVREVPGPYMATLSHAAGRAHLGHADLEAAGVAAASYPSLTLFAAAQAVTSAMRELKQDGSLARANQHAMALEEYYELVALKEQATLEEGFDIAAAVVMAKGAAE
ncbi:MAG TPA: isocitrate lyase/phosphoenolpyruvate mutase family protein [Xanthobacteraceae bacterium]